MFMDIHLIIQSTVITSFYAMNIFSFGMQRICFLANFIIIQKYPPLCKTNEKYFFSSNLFVNRF